MADERLSGKALEKALRGGEFDKPSLEIVGMVKASEEAGNVSFSPTDCESWIDVPTDLIASAERVGDRPCRDHSHPVFRLVLKESDDPSAKLLAAVVASFRRTRPTPVAPRGPRLPYAPPHRYLARPNGPGGGGLQDGCVGSLQDCYVDCAVRYPDDPNSLNDLYRQACEDSCDAAYRLCRGFGFGGVLGAIW
jgi:hypothetical protein